MILIPNIDLNNVNDQPPPIMRLSNAQHHAQMLSHFHHKKLINFYIDDVIEFEKILERLKKIIISNCFRYGQRTLGSFIVSHS